MRVFYTEHIDSGKLLSEEAQHAARVLRLKTGDQISLVNGHGTVATALITDIDKRNCSYKIVETKEESNPVSQIEIAIAPTKSNDRLEWMIEKLTEIGIGKIHLVFTKRTEKARLKPERLFKKVISAAKQSHKSHFPSIIIHEKFSDFISTTNFDQQFIAHLIEEERTYIGQEIQKEGSLCLLIGPEGDFTENEVHKALENGYKSVTLGDFRLRTETAAIYAATVINHTRYL